MRYTTHVIRAATACAVLLVAGGCGDGDPSGPSAPVPCTGSVTVSVSAGTTPTFTWSPACTVRFLRVEQEANDRWFIEATGSAGIASGVTYGTVPSGATQDEPAIALTAGLEHEVALYTGTVTSPVLVGMRDFTP